MYLEEHPNPTLARENWTDLNGIWKFRFDDKDEGRTQGWQNGFDAEYKIRVPFCYQSQKSGIGITEQHDILWYSRLFHVNGTDAGKAVLIHFGAVDYACTVWVNGLYAGSHVGGGTHFTVDAAPCIHPGENLLVVRSENTYSCEIPRGKQCWQEELTRCWYTPTGGIWKSVWMEITEALYVRKLRITPDIDRAEAGIELCLSRSSRCSVCARVVFEGLPCQELQIKANGERGIFLNHQRLYQRLVLDQGYWPDSLMTPPDDQAIRRDIELTKAMGFNGARKHQKMEDARYYYWANKMGLMVWGECPSAYSFSADSTVNIEREWAEFVEERYNNPCIIAWVPLNESWGVRRILTDRRQQALAASLYYLTKKSFLQ